ncbi:hypothetical protein QW131_15405 [Roseibium salinum]|nr:hypothetical protein [Roseibium salinum]
MRDASFIAANMRPEDHREIACLWKDWDTRALGVCAMETAVPGMVWSVWYDGQPAAAYGFSRASAFDPDHWQAWAFGTERFRRCVPLITRHVTSLRPLIEQECRRLQAITLQDHDIAHGWIEALGGKNARGSCAPTAGAERIFFVYAWVRRAGTCSCPETSGSNSDAHLHVSPLRQADQ